MPRPSGGWTFSPETGGFHVTTGVDEQSFANYYVVENRQYIGPDKLRVGFDGPLGVAPYNFGGTIGPNWAERHPYEDGVLIWYWNTEYANNNVGDHPGEGEILPVDAHPGLLHWSDGSIVRARIQSYDSTFGVKKTDAITLHNAGGPDDLQVAAGRRTVRRHAELVDGDRSGQRPGQAPGRLDRRQRPEDRHPGGGQGQHQEGLLGQHRGHARRSRLGGRVHE